MKRLLLALTVALMPHLALAGVKVVKDAPNTTEVYQSKRVALLVGVDQYGDEALTTLSFSGKDANDLATVLRSDTGGGFDEVTVLTGPERTTRSAILDTLDKITSDLQRDDTLLVYLSGHGTLTLDAINGTELYFLPSDATLDQPKEQGVLVSWLEETLADKVARRRVLILDTCHNGRSKSGLSNQTEQQLSSLRGEPPAPNTVRQVSESEARLYAAHFYQPAMEDKALQNGVYTHYLIQSLTAQATTADLNQDGLVDVTEAHDYAQDRTVRHTGGLQVPRAEYRIVGREAIYLSGDPSKRQSAENALVSAYQGILASARLFIDGKSRGTLPGVVAVEPGRHRIEVKTDDGRLIGRTTAALRAGEHLQVEQLLGPQSDRWTLLLGGQATFQGQGAAYTVPLGLETELSYSRRPGHKLIQPVVYGRFSWSIGHVGDDDDSENLEQSGWVTAGGVLGFSPTPKLLLGPQLEVGSLFRSGTWFGDSYQQASPLIVPGARAQVFIPVGKRQELSLRYDARAQLFRQNNGWASSLTHGLAIGVALR